MWRYLPLYLFITIFILNFILNFLLIFRTGSSTPGSTGLEVNLVLPVKDIRQFDWRRKTLALKVIIWLDSGAIRLLIKYSFIVISIQRKELILITLERALPIMPLGIGKHLSCIYSLSLLFWVKSLFNSWETVT